MYLIDDISYFLVAWVADMLAPSEKEVWDQQRKEKAERDAERARREAEFTSTVKVGNWVIDVSNPLKSYSVAPPPSPSPPEGSVDSAQGGESSVEGSDGATTGGAKRSVKNISFLTFLFILCPLFIMSAVSDRYE